MQPEMVLVQGVSTVTNSIPFSQTLFHMMTVYG